MPGSREFFFSDLTLILQTDSYKAFKQTHTYKAETGRDISDDFGVNEETWLSTVACAAPQCPNFLRRLGKVSATAEGKPRISDAVLRHLQTEPLWIMGSNRCAKELLDEELDDEQVRYRVALLRSGELMREGGQDMRKRKAHQMESVMQLEASLNCSSSYSTKCRPVITTPEPRTRNSRRSWTRHMSCP